jgi:multicomponent Na+:H+ antiporter subunit F
MPDQHTLFLVTALLLTLAALLYVYRVVVGPTVFDRLVGLAGIGTKTILLLILIGALYGRLDMVVDIALGYALLNFVAALASAKYFERGKGPGA